MRIALAAVVLVSLAPPALAQRVSAEDIINALQARGNAAAIANPARIRAGAQNLVVAPADNGAPGRPPAAMIVLPPAATINPGPNFGNPGQQQLVVNPPGQQRITVNPPGPQQAVINPPGNGNGRQIVVSPMVVNPQSPPPQPPVTQMVVLPPSQGNGPQPIAIPPQPRMPVPAGQIVEAGLPSIDLEIYFDTASAEILPRSREQLIALGYALTDPRLASQYFVVGGHTDARGTNEYNRDLSNRRAEAVRAFLIQQFPILPSMLQIVGYGEDYLRDPGNPDAAVNRRVQIVNLGN